MFNETSTNAEIAKHDWAWGDRTALLRLLHARPAPRAVTATSGWGTDVTGNDPRSVHAYLKGKGDLRGTWWNLYSAIYTTIVPGAALERVMFSFHCLHHAITLSRLGFTDAVATTVADIEQNGILTAAQRSIKREMHR